MNNVFFALIFLVVGLVTGIFVGKNSPHQDADAAPREVRLGENKFTNPLLECEVNNAIGEKEYKPSKSKINSYIADELNKKSITHASVYYRDLNNGPWFGINERENFSPASLLKLPVLMAYLKQAEKNPFLLTKKLLYKKESAPVEQNFIPNSPLQDAKEYTIDELLEHMIIYSDNDALFLLEKNIDSRAIDAITKDLGIETATESTPEDYLSVKSYASLLRVLFNASYLNAEMSEKALTMLTKVAFTKGIVSGLPKDLPIAHKFGERELPNDVKQLHDCGIVYYPRHPYLLCIMTRGTDYEKLETVIGTIST
ncbi:serine hydrolase [Candidatus Gottesmanbacteria bacterium]|nr:serine hydrolase [Candidatus Gottesmanbacteria bacterium]